MGIKRSYNNLQPENRDKVNELGRYLGGGLALILGVVTAYVGAKNGVYKLMGWAGEDNKPPAVSRSGDDIKSLSGSELVSAFKQQGYNVKVVNQDPQTQGTDYWVPITTGLNDPILKQLVNIVADDEYGQPDEQVRKAKKRIGLYYNTHTGKFTAVVEKK